VDVAEAIRKRFSVRKYKKESIDEEMLARVLESARLAPTARNLQQLRFLVVTDSATKKALVPACKDQAFVADAGALIVGCGLAPDYRMPCGQQANVLDISIAFSFVMLAAVEEGLGTCWLGAFDEDQLRKILGIPEGVCVPAVLTLGVQDEPAGHKSRKTADELFVRNRWR